MILCCGEALIDMIPTPCGDGATGFVPHSGGAVFNTAIALGRLGAPAGMLTGLSTDLFGRQLAGSLAEAGVATGLVVTSDRPTTLAFVQLTDGQARYTFYDENSAGRMIAPGELPALPAEVTALFFGGISLISEPGAETYAALAGRAGDRAVMLDPNIRPGFVSDATGYRARLERMIARADIVKVSDEDLDWLYPGPAPLPDKMARMQAAGPAVVVLTRGAKGATALLPGGGHVEVPSARTTVVDTVGAGDTFNAGVMARLAERDLLRRPALAALAPEPLRDALAFGARVAAVTVSRAGANPPWRREL